MTADHDTTATPGASPRVAARPAAGLRSAGLPDNVIDLAGERARRRGRGSVEPWVGKPELAERLGRSARWIDLRIAEGLPCIRVEGRLRFQSSIVEDWLHHHGPDAG